MRRRAFIAGLGGAVASSLVRPPAARAQQSEPTRRLGVLIGWEETDAEAKVWFSEFFRTLTERGWTEGRNLRLNVRWAGDRIDAIRTFSKELVEQHPDAIFAIGTAATAALQRETRTIPIVFAMVGDPIGNGFVSSLSRPSGNLTGFVAIEAEMAGKWLELLTEIAPTVKRVAIIFNPDTAPGGGSYYLPAFEAAAQAHKVVPTAAPVRSDAEIETVIASLGRESGGGFIQMRDNFMQVHSEAIVSLATRYNVPAVYVAPHYVRLGGLLSYGPDFTDMFRRAAPYVDRILRGDKPADLPVQLPIKFEMAINAKTAKALGLAIPPSILLNADEVIE